MPGALSDMIFVNKSYFSVDRYVVLPATEIMANAPLTQLVDDIPIHLDKRLCHGAETL